MRQFLQPVFLLLLFACLAACGSGAGLRSDLKPSVSVSEWLAEAPDFASLAGRPVVIEFWGTWCPPCIKTTPHLVELAERYEDQGLFIAGIHHPKGASDRAQIEAFVDQFDIPYTIGMDVDGSATKTFKVEGIPRAFVFDKKGRLTWEGHPGKPEFEAAIQAAL